MSQGVQGPLLYDTTYEANGRTQRRQLTERNINKQNIKKTAKKPLSTCKLIDASVVRIVTIRDANIYLLNIIIIEKANNSRKFYNTAVIRMANCFLNLQI